MNKDAKDSESSSGPESLRCVQPLQKPPPALDALHSITDPIVRTALDLFKKHPSERWTVQDLARTIGTSRPVLNRHFAEALQKPPLRALREIRMALAAELLTQSDDGLAAVADAVGYDSEFAFSRAFFRHFGKRPGAFRRDYAWGTTGSTVRCAA